MSRDSPDPLTDWLARTALGDRQAFKSLFDATRSVLFGVCLRILRDREEAEEVLQDAYLRVWNHAGEYSSIRGAPLTWLTSIARNRCLDVIRRRGVDDGHWQDHFADTVADEGPSPEAQALFGVEARAVRRCLDGLDAAHRQAIEIAFFDGLAHPEIAVRLKRPLGTVKSQIRRGLMKLKDCLGA